MTNNNKTLVGGSYNLLFGRPLDVVKGEVERLIKKHDLDFLAVQEGQDYERMLGTVKGFNYFTEPGRGANENGVLVRDGLTADKFKSKFYGDGWTTINGDHHVAAVQNEVRIDGWLKVRGLHLPTPSSWKDGRISPETPAERKDDLIASMKGLRYYLSWPSTKVARIAVGDWNEAPTTSGEYSPKWLETTTKSASYTPTSRAGHGHIDWVMAKGCRITNIFKDLDIREYSDHEPVIFTVRKQG